MGDLSTHFSREEFACRCGCGAAHINTDLVALLEMIREAAGRPLVILSGVRCRAHNRAVGGKENSAHLKGLAVDILCEDSRLRHDLSSLALHAGIGRVGIASTFVHLDIDRSLPQEVLWLY